MIPDHDCVPGLERPVTVSEYAQLEGLTEAQVLSFIHEFKIRNAAYFRGQWFIEAPRNSEARLAQLRGAAPAPTPTPTAPTAPRQPNESGQKIAPVAPKPSPLPAAAAAQPSAAAQRPLPVDYGLTYDDLNLYDRLGKWWRLDDGNTIPCVGTRPDDKYKKGRRWFGILRRQQARMESIGGLGFWALFIGVFMTFGKESRQAGLITVGVGGACFLFGLILPGYLIKRAQQRASPALIAYWQAIDRYDREKAAIEEAARKAARDAELRKRSYWTFLDGYAFERATAEVLNKHHFNAVVTPGSADGGIDIEVTRNGLRGVVQCKAHMACVGPHVVRDLYGVIHHTRASFGIMVSLGGFSKGAVEFARDKPILFVNLDDLIAMQEGKDVLAAAFDDQQ